MENKVKGPICSRQGGRAKKHVNILSVTLWNTQLIIQSWARGCGHLFWVISRKRASGRSEASNQAQICTLMTCPPAILSHALPIYLNKSGLKEEEELAKPCMRRWNNPPLIQDRPRSSRRRRSNPERSVQLTDCITNLLIVSESKVHELRFSEFREDLLSFPLMSTWSKAAKRNQWRSTSIDNFMNFILQL